MVIYMAQLKWLALGYNVPANPSRKRVYVWRKLRDFGAEYFRPGVAVLPYTKAGLTRMRHLAGKIQEMGGESSIVEMSFLDPADEAELISRFRSHTADEYRGLLRDFKAISAELSRESPSPDVRKEAARRVARRYKEVRSRDYFTSDLSQDVQEVLGILGEYVGSGADDFFDQFTRLLDALE